MKYWLTAVSSAQSTSCRTWTTSSFPFMEVPLVEVLKGGSYPACSAARGEVVVKVGQAGRAQPPAAGVALDGLEALPLLVDAPRDLVEGQPRALAARHHAPATDCRLEDPRGHQQTHLHDNETRFQVQLTLVIPDHRGAISPYFGGCRGAVAPLPRGSKPPMNTLEPG